MGMCWVANCKHYNVRDTCRFFRFPKAQNERTRWIHLLRRDVEPGPGAFVCSCHFRGGKKENGPEIFLHNIEKRMDFPSLAGETGKRRQLSAVSASSVAMSSNELQQPAMDEAEVAGLTTSMETTDIQPGSSTSTTSKLSTFTAGLDARIYFLEKEVEEPKKLKKIKSNENCCVPNCRSVRKENPNIMYHQFPKPEQKIKFINDRGIEEECNRRNLWISKLRIGKPVSTSMKVCSLHFTEDDYEKSGWATIKHLKRSSVPSQCLPFSSHSRSENNQKLKRIKTVISCQVNQNNEDVAFEGLLMLASNPISSPLLEGRFTHVTACKNKKEEQTDTSELRSEAPEVMYEMHCEQEKRSSAETPEITTPELAMDRTIKTEVESDYETDGCIKTESFFEAEDDPLIEVKTEILDIKTELESSQPRFISRATSVSPDHMHGSRNLINEQINKHKNRIKVLEQIRLRQSKKIKELENLLQYYTNK
ncbi:uncharacterized protein LOC123007480 [Tribolium madens]|uniref:uncharacterized protein LOC123007480 n=1 Tax=Tribolium madens TaxID=41895 RepID=UPI001CF72873|nr:uncharacterized protein LOC123007480 [Tribolium madens]XP_044258746.1 uncharacterized protein LOC123007480 [Tribolium madens]